MSLLSELDKVQELAEGSKAGRLLHRPGKYIIGQVFSKFIYPLFHRPLAVHCKTFWGERFLVALPAGMDIYLTGGKSHDSEIRLARFAIKHLTDNTVVFDIGAHYGYFSNLFHQIANKGQVVAIEAASHSFSVLQQNCTGKGIKIFQYLISDKRGTSEFYEYPVQYSEYNSVDNTQFEDEEWNRKLRFRKVVRETVIIDRLCEDLGLKPDFIKIDVEGAEAMVIQGAHKLLSEGKVIVAMEFINGSRHNENHIKADRMLKELGYQSFLIDKEGNLEGVDDMAGYLETAGLESDNVIYRFGGVGTQGQ